MSKKLSAELSGMPWAIDGRYFRAMKDMYTTGGLSTPSGLLKRYAAANNKSEPGPGYEIIGSIAVVPIEGILLKDVPIIYRRLEIFGIRFTEYRHIGAAARAAAEDPDIENILLHVSSPGGTVAGAEEAAEAIYRAREKKRVIAYIEDLGASGAFLLASQAEEVYSNVNALVGGIGVYTVYFDWSKAAEKEGVTVHVIKSGEHKGMGEPGAPITHEQLRSVKKYIDRLAGNMVGDIARGRCKTKTEIYRAGGSGALLLASVAKARGLVDGVQSLEETVEQLEAWEEPEDPARAAEEAGVLAREKERIRQRALHDLLKRDPELCLKAITEGWTLEKAEGIYMPIVEKKTAERKKKIAALEKEIAALEDAEERREKAENRGSEGIEFNECEW